MSVETLAWEEQQEYSHVEWPTNPAGPGALPAGPGALPADGTKSGKPETTQASLETPDANNKNPLLKPPTFAKMLLQRELSGQRMAAAAEQNPDWPPAKGNPKTEGELNEKLTEDLNGV